MAYSVQHHVTNRGIELQGSIRQMLSEQQRFTHWVTLNFNRKHSVGTAQKILQLWFMNMNARLFRSSRFRAKDTSDLFFFFAFPEETLKEKPHFHLMARVAAERCEYFEKLAGPKWEACVSSGSSDAQRIGDSDDDHEWVATYATKNANRAFSHDGFIISTNLADGRQSGRARRRSVADA